MRGGGAEPAISLMQVPGDPVPFGPSVWTWKQYTGIGVYTLLFLLFLFVVARLARPERDTELPPPSVDD